MGLWAGRQHCEVMVELGSWLTLHASGWVYPNQGQGFPQMAWVQRRESHSYQAALRMKRKREEWKRTGLFQIIIFSLQITILNNHNHPIFISKGTSVIPEPERKGCDRNKWLGEEWEARSEELRGASPGLDGTCVCGQWPGRQAHHSQFVGGKL